MKLNHQQAAAAFAPPTQPHAIVAGAGTGKTATMVQRFVHLVRGHGYDPTRIVAVTFTNKAAAELRERITVALLSAGAITDRARLDSAWIGTFHTLCLRLLREHCYTVGFDRTTGVIEPLAERLLVAEIHEMLLDNRVVGADVSAPEALGVEGVIRLADAAFDFIRRIKGRGLNPAQLRDRCASGWSGWWGGGGPGDRSAFPTDALAEQEAAALLCATYAEYERRLEAAGLIDFDGIVLRTQVALTERPTWAAMVRAQFQYLIVDEYQDTNRTQAQVIELLAHPGLGNVSVVGDPKQSIYGWRDADLRNLQEFAGAQHILDVNYRSHQPILDLAAHVISHDARFAGDPVLQAQTPEGPRVTAAEDDPVVVAIAQTPDLEARWVAGNIRELHDNHGVAWQEIAVLSRLRNPPIAFEKELRAAGIPYITAAGYGFYEREEVKDVLALLEVVENPLDDPALVRLLQGPGCRVSDAALYALVRGRHGPGHHHRKVWDALVASEADGFPEFDADTSHSVRTGLALVRSLADSRAGMSVRDLVQEAIARGGAAARARDDPVESERRTGNLRKLVRLASDFEASSMFSGVGEFLRYTDLHERFGLEVAEADDVDADAVRLLTVHAAKGLEFPYVFFVHLRPPLRRHAGYVFFDDEHGVILRTLDGSKETTTSKFTAWSEQLKAENRRDTDVAADELRRLVYVALTRAQRRVYVSATRPDTTSWDELTAVDPRAPEDDHFLAIAEFAREHGARCELVGDVPPPSSQPRTDAHHAPAGEASPPLPPRAPRERMPLSRRGRLDVSFSQVEVMAQCPLRYRYLFEWRIPTPPDDLWPDSARHQATIAAGRLGELVHRTLQSCHPPGRVQLTLDGIRAAWDEAARGVLDLPDAERVWEVEAAAMFVNYLSSPIAGMETIATEQEFNLAVDIDDASVMIRGFVDRLCRDQDGRLLVVDYKTNRDVSAATHAAHDRQLAIYRRAVTDALGMEGDVDACVLALRSGRRIDGDPGGWDDVVVLLRRLVEGDRSAPPAPPCSSCGFAAACPSSTVLRTVQPVSVHE